MKHQSSSNYCIFLTVPSIDLYEPQINVLSPHTCIGKTEYFPLTVLDKQSPSSLSEPPSEISENFSSAPANPLPEPPIQNRKRKANSDSDSSDRDDTGG